jgi:hypothetical protein
VSKAGSNPFVRIGGSGSLVDFPDPEAGVDARVSIRSRRSENASKTVASLSKFGDAGTGAGEFRAASWALSCSISAVAASRSSWRTDVWLGALGASAVWELEDWLALPLALPLPLPLLLLLPEREPRDDIVAFYWMGW